MALSEFSIIDEFFKLDAAYGRSPVVNIGDDCAVLDVPAGYQLAVSTDTLVDGVHFLPDSDPEFLGHKVLAVNLSDLAAMGATPAWVSLAITLPRVDRDWLAAFSKGFFALAGRYSLRLIGGDTTRGPLSITVNIMGLLPKNQRLTRAGARVGDDVYVSGSFGSAGLGLLKAKLPKATIKDADVAAYLKPEPCVELGEALLPIATSCIDISDGLSADLNHILLASGVGARIEHSAVPLTQSVAGHVQQLRDVFWPYSTGDDYQLCFTVPSKFDLSAIEKKTASKITKIGLIEKGCELRVVKDNGEQQVLNKGYEHFS